MHLITISFVLGICSLFVFPTVPGAVAALAASAALVLLCRRRLYPVVALLLGFAWAMLHAALATGTPALIAALEGRTVLVEGRVIGTPERRDSRLVRFLIRSERLDDGTGWRDFDARLRLGWYDTGAAPAAGERWRLALRLKRPHGLANPGGFDHERWLFQQRIRATGHVRNDPRNRRLSAAQLSPLAEFRGRLLGAFPHLGPGTGAAFVRALTVGERGAIGAAQWRVLNATGTSHLMAISGLHISLVAGLTFWLVRRGWVRLGRSAARIPAPHAAAAAAMGAATLYALLAGFGIPARRALVMVCALMLALLTARHAAFGRVVCLAALATLVLDPLSVLAAGWWLSFLAVVIIAWLVTGRLGTQGRVRRRLLLHLALAFGMTPVLLLIFQQAPLLAPLANLLAVPFVGLLIVPLALLGCGLFALSEALGTWLLGVAALLLEMAWPALQWLAATEPATWTRHPPPLWALPPALAGLALLCMPRGLPARWVGGVLVLPLLLVRPPSPTSGAAWVTLLDVGQGLAAVVRTARHTLVYDTGPLFGPAYDTGQAVVVPFLRRQGVNRLDTLVVSHGDNDHIGGAASLLAVYPAAAVYSSVPERLAGTATRRCRSGQRWEWDGVEFVMLHPGDDAGLTGNNASCVLRIATANGQRLLLPGDIERDAEQRLVAMYPRQLGAGVLVAPHHGSATSSSPAFVSAVAPETVLVPAGWLNRYRFPKRGVLERYRSAGASILETGRHGAISVKLSASAVRPEISTWREQDLHLWNWRE